EGTVEFSCRILQGAQVREIRLLSNAVPGIGAVTLGHRVFGAAGGATLGLGGQLLVGAIGTPSAISVRAGQLRFTVAAVECRVGRLAAAVGVMEIGVGGLISN